MAQIYCPSCNSDKSLGVIRHETIIVQSDSNTDNHNIQLPYVMSAWVKCFNCNAEFLTSCSLDFEVNPF
jgi:hypothetical protein